MQCCIYIWKFVSGCLILLMSPEIFPLMLRAAHTGKLKMRLEGWLVWQVMLMPIYMSPSQSISCDQCWIWVPCLFQSPSPRIPLDSNNYWILYIKFTYPILWLFNYSFSFGSSSESDGMGVKAVMKVCSEIFIRRFILWDFSIGIYKSFYKSWQ